jgi:ribosomal silencing factor RsfS
MVVVVVMGTEKRRRRSRRRDRREKMSGDEGGDGRAEQKRAEAQWGVIDMISLRRSNLRSLSLSL